MGGRGGHPPASWEQRQLEASHHISCHKIEMRMIAELSNGTIRIEDLTPSQTQPVPQTADPGTFVAQVDAEARAEA